MNEKAYTSDEKELFELLEFLIKAYKSYPAKNDKEKKDVKEIIIGYQDFENGIKGFAEVRYDKQIAKENEIKNKIFQVYNCQCEHCKNFNSLKPLREETGKMEITFYVFKCSKCNKEFNGLPNTDKGMIIWNDNLVKLLLEPHPDGGNLAQKAKIPRQGINDMIMASDRFKECVRIEKEEEEVQRKNDENVAILVRDSIAQYTIDKHKLMTGNETIGES